MEYDLYISVHSNFIYNNSKVERAQIAISRWMDKQIVVYFPNGILLSNEKNEQTIDACKGMGESHRRYVEWKKPDT